MGRRRLKRDQLEVVTESCRMHEMHRYSHWQPSVVYNYLLLKGSIRWIIWVTTDRCGSISYSSCRSYCWESGKQLSELNLKELDYTVCEKDWLEIALSRHEVIIVIFIKLEPALVIKDLGTGTAEYLHNKVNPVELYVVHVVSILGWGWMRDSNTEGYISIVFHKWTNAYSHWTIERRLMEEIIPMIKGWPVATANKQILLYMWGSCRFMAHGSTPMQWCLLRKWKRNIRSVESFQICRS